MNQPISMYTGAMHIHAPTTSYSMVFKHLRGRYTIINGDVYQCTYLCNGEKYTTEGVLTLLTGSAQPLPPMKGHTVATAAYIFGTPDCTGPYKVGISLRPTSKGVIRCDYQRRLAMTRAISTLPPADRAFFHLTMALMEGRDVLPVVKTALVSRPGPDREILLQHLYSMIGAALVKLDRVNTYNHH
ncbi:hypothetical protein [Microcoleus phage My-WqHQDG]|nr:hypothetical protein [Microcoleus phage My-WqHQDG]